uniref:Sulfotransferase domain-containing protein n=1 Tax=Ditylum brightwellii TaxID=49249 RepID=A0A7S4VTC8_9STRA
MVTINRISTTTTTTSKKNKTLYRFVSTVLLLTAFYTNYHLVMPGEEEQFESQIDKAQIEVGGGLSDQVEDKFYVEKEADVVFEPVSNEDTKEAYGAGEEQVGSSAASADGESGNDANENEESEEDTDTNDEIESEDDSKDETEDAKEESNDETDLAMDKDADDDDASTEDDLAMDKASDDADSKTKLAESVAILGERSSGTTWIYEHLTECFNHSVPIKRRLNRYKHWFQEDSNYPSNSLVIAIFRNPYDWMEAMHRVPHHSPSHMDLSWKEFLTKTWTTERVGHDLNITDTKSVVCQENFQYHEVVSCIHKPMGQEYWEGKKTRFSEHQPVYELKHDGSGEPYDNIMELRAAKNVNFMEVKDFKRITDFWVYKYESLLKEGTEDFLRRIEEATGVKRTCVAAEAQNRRKRPLDKDMMKFLDKHLDWDAEALIGYEKGKRE